MPIDRKYLDPFFADNYPTSPFYKEAIAINDQLTDHSDNEKYPAHLIEAARPNEDEKYKTYRKSVYTPITFTYFEKVLNTIAKIRRAEDWGIDYPDKNTGVIADGETLEDYCEKDFPFFGSISNWFFSLGIKTFVEDPNAVFAVYPLSVNESDSEYVDPYPTIFQSKNVLYFQNKQFACLLSDDKSMITNGNAQVQEGRIYYFFDKNNFEIWQQYGEKINWTFQPVQQTETNINEMPVYKFGGKIKKFHNGESLYDSIISACLPFWKEAIRRYSDHQVNMVLHLHPDRWEVEDTPCKICKGEGFNFVMKGAERTQQTCRTCGGSGSLTYKTPFGVKIIKPAVKNGVNDSINVPTPPMGNVARDIAALLFLKEEYKADVKDGLSALNMEFLMEVPITNSGTSKSYDMDALNTYMHSVGRHIVENIFKQLYKTINDYRYNYESARDQNLPIINVPQKFDIVNSSIIAQRLKVSKDGGFNHILNTALQIEFAESEFGASSMPAKLIKVADVLDPLPNRNEDEKMVILSNNGCTQEDYILSAKMSSFIQRALIENEFFLDLKYDQQLAMVLKYVDEVIKKNKDKQAAGVPINKDPNLDPNAAGGNN